MKANTKDWIQYGTAVTMIASGIVLGFLSFFFNDGDITNGVLYYVAQSLVYAGSIFGVNIYIRTKYGEAESKILSRVKEIVESMTQGGEMKNEK